MIPVDFEPANAPFAIIPKDLRSFSVACRLYRLAVEEDKPKSKVCRATDFKRVIKKETPPGLFCIRQADLLRNYETNAKFKIETTRPEDNEENRAYLSEREKIVAVCDHERRTARHSINYTVYQF